MKLEDDWLSDLTKYRKFLFDCVLSAAASEHSPNKGAKRDCGCADRVYPRPHEIDRHHDPKCKHGILLRLLGGPEVALRQMYASHELALMMDAEETRLRQLATFLLELAARRDWVPVEGNSKRVQELKLRGLIKVRAIPGGGTDAHFVPREGFMVLENVHEAMHLIRTTRAHEQCWDCDNFSLHNEDAPGHCKHCDQDWPPEGPCV